MAKAFQDVAMNPANISKYQDNPKVQEVINKMSKKFGPGGKGNEEEGQGAGEDGPAGFS